MDILLAMYILAGFWICNCLAIRMSYGYNDIVQGNGTYTPFQAIMLIISYVYVYAITPEPTPMLTLVAVLLTFGVVRDQFRDHKGRRERLLDGINHLSQSQAEKVVGNTIGITTGLVMGANIMFLLTSIHKCFM